MKKTYTPPPGYDGSRFVARNGEVHAMEDSDYTLSVGGIPTGKGRNREERPQEQPEHKNDRHSENTDSYRDRSRGSNERRRRPSYYSGDSRRNQNSGNVPRRGVYSSGKPSRVNNADQNRHDHGRDEPRHDTWRYDDHEYVERRSLDLEDEERFRRTGGRISPVEPEDTVYTMQEEYYDDPDTDDSYADSHSIDDPKENYATDPDAIPTALRDSDVPREHRESCPVKEGLSLFNLFGEGGDLLLILLIILLSGEKDTGNLVLTLAILLAIR